MAGIFFGCPCGQVTGEEGEEEGGLMLGPAGCVWGTKKAARYINFFFVAMKNRTSMLLVGSSKSSRIDVSYI